MWKTGFKNKEHRENNNHRGKREYWKVWEQGSVNKHVDLMIEIVKRQWCNMVQYGFKWFCVILYESFALRSYARYVLVYLEHLMLFWWWSCRWVWCCLTSTALSWWSAAGCSARGHTSHSPRLCLLQFCAVDIWRHFAWVLNIITSFW